MQADSVGEAQAQLQALHRLVVATVRAMDLA